MNNNTIFFVISIVMDEFTMLLLQKYSLRVCMISLGFYSTHYKDYIHIPCINTQIWRTEPFDITHIIKSSDYQTTTLYQGSANFCEGHWNSNTSCLLQPSQTIHYCNQSVLLIVPDLNLFIWSITIFDLI